ncbi:glycoside hydrolase family 3 C-terminal domain-containing protein [Sphingomonas sp. IC-56]|uniref:glycoside hydrolase family 3 C-terminal domain-containing protein n=1 Tax=Sphingomonas sp. IC-56 TaxID=2898529 RepID=UPI001E457F0D|nr:glycoside hydrolase family 3 C-terminal domain-containing protein [Sphingomonas sp. IC-56]MCD2322797.1 glycoside hydrolase family 3 C-terminal domain-containing protein [Sphingomonas sp. IC-56]
MIPFLLLAAAEPDADALAKAIATMTLEEKAAQLQSTAPANAEAGLPAFDWWNEGLHGLARNGYATVFPQAIGLAATWDVDLLGKVGDVVATEARAKFNARPLNADRRIYEGLTIWSPNINIFRDPRWGRGQETYGEDPYLTGHLGVAFIRGLQGPDPKFPKVIATPKHYAVHSGPEAGRDSFDVDPSPQDLESTYLPAFRLAVTEGKARSLMCAYNSIHGVPLCALPELMNTRLRTDWGFNGFTVSDCDAVANIHLFHHYRLDGAAASAAAIKGGNDLNCGNTYAALPEAVARGLVSEAEIDTALTRALSARQALGTILGATSPWNRIKPSEVGTPANRALALDAARKAIVLLKNDADRLPLKPGSRIAVIGANADDLNVLEGNYHGTAKTPVTPLDGIRRQFGAANVRYAQGSVLADGAPVVMPETAFTADGKPGLKAEYFASATVTGAPAAVRQDRRIDFNYTRVAPLPELDAKGFAVRWSGEIVPPGPGRYTLALEIPACWTDCKTHDSVRLWIDNKPLHQGLLGKTRVEMPFTSDGSRHSFRMELDHAGEDEGIRLLWLPPAEPLLTQAVTAAKDADVIVAVLGLSPDLEGEALQVTVPGFAGGDRTDIGLPFAQQRLLQALRDTGKPVVLVLTNGSAIAVDPAQADAILTAWYPGESGGTAIAETLAGLNNPSGRLPVTFYKSTSDLPAFVDYGMKERTYRFFTGTPLWGFGHGLSYTSFAYDALTAKAGALGAPVEVSVRVRNSGARAGDEVVQAYVVPPALKARTMTTPILQRELAGFRRVTLKPGKASTLRFTLDPRSLSTVARDGTRRVVPGAYRLWVGGGQPGSAPGQWADFTLNGEAQELPK